MTINDTDTVCRRCQSRVQLSYDVEQKFLLNKNYCNIDVISMYLTWPLCVCFFLYIVLHIVYTQCTIKT